MKSINTTFANKNILTKLLVFHGLNPLDHDYKYSSNQKKEELLEKTVYLELYVKTIKKWRDKESTLTEFGFTDFDK